MGLETSKVCSKCKQEKDASCFVKCASQKSGLYSSCKECNKNRNKAYRDGHKKESSNWQKKHRVENPEKYKLASAKYHAENKDIVNAKKRVRYLANPELSKQRYKAEYQMNKNKESYKLRIRNNKLFRLYGITVEDYDAMYIEQGGRCAICGMHQIELPRRLSVDHCHDTGMVRGLLCRKCNAGLGQYNDDLQFLKNAVKYLEMGGASCYQGKS